MASAVVAGYVGPVCPLSRPRFRSHPCDTVRSPPATGLPYRDIKRSYKSALDAIELDREVTFHTLRHTAASHLAMAGCDLLAIASILGHKDLKMTKRYAHLAPDFLQDVVGKLQYGKSEKAKAELGLIA